MLIDQAKLQAGHRVLIWGAGGGLGVFATQLCAITGAESVGVVSSAQKGDLVRQLGARDVIDRNEFTGMMRRGGEDADAEKARFKESRRFCKEVSERLGGMPDIVFEHVGRATFPTSVLAVKPFGTVGDLRRDLRLPARLRRALSVDAPEAHRRVALRQRVGVPSGQRADRAGQDPAGPVADPRVRRRGRGTPAHVQERAPRQDRDPRGRGFRGTWEDVGRPGRDPGGGWSLMAGTVHIPWYATLFRGDKFELALAEIAAIAMRYGATRYQVHRSRDDRYKFLQMTTFENHADWERYWYGPEFVDWRATTRAGTRCRCSTPGTTSSPRAPSSPSRAQQCPRPHDRHAVIRSVAVRRETDPPPSGRTYCPRPSWRVRPTLSRREPPGRTVIVSPGASSVP
jgi:NAD(P)-dependent dehydrogenase (short-subunit alcohol dehydrogenase family)